MAVSGLIVRALGGGSASTIPNLIRRGLSVGAAEPAPEYLPGVVPIYLEADARNNRMPIYSVLANGVPVYVTTNAMNNLVPCVGVATGAGVPVIVVAGSL